MRIGSAFGKNGNFCDIAGAAPPAQTSWLYRSLPGGLPAEPYLVLGDDAMLLEELDGFIAGLLVCPN
jgi:hypothetical protein